MNPLTIDLIRRAKQNPRLNRITAGLDVQFLTRHFGSGLRGAVPYHYWQNHPSCPALLLAEG